MIVELLLPIAVLSSIAAIYHWIAAARAFDRLVKRMHDSDNLRWKALGSPVGFFWRPRYSLREWTSAISGRNRLVSEILFSRRQFESVDDDLPRFRRLGVRFVALCIINVCIIVIAAMKR